MDDYEVDLIDYLRVMWKGKWIILACLVVALAVSAAIMWTRPNEYAVTVQHQYHEQLSELLAACPTSGTNVPAQQNNTLQAAVDATQAPSSQPVTKKTTLTNGFVRTTLSGAVPPTDLAQVAADFSSLVKKELTQQMSDSILVAINSANLRVGQLTKERDMLKERMTAALATNASLTDYLAEKVADLEGSIVQNQVLVETLQGTDPSALFQLSASQQGVSSIGPNRKMSVAVAGVLGLFVGVLLAFFVHYLVSAREREAARKQA